MKVCILTQPLGHNYGGLLQAYALQTCLKRLGCTVETLDRRHPVHTVESIQTHAINLARLLLGRIRSMPTQGRQDQVLRHLHRFRDRSISMSPTITDEQAIRRYFEQNPFDAVIVGSDQVWRPRYSPSLPNYFLDFLAHTSQPVKRIAYAASFGVDEWEFTDSATAQCKALLSQFDAVSVREKSAVALCQTHLNAPAQLVLDPTLLLDPADYTALTNECKPNPHAGSIVSYILDPSPSKHSITQTIAQALNTPVHTLKPEHKPPQVRASVLEQCTLPPVESWLQAFQDARFVVTDSFHGSVFAILFNKPFIAIGNPARGMARFESLLSQFGLESRLIASAAALNSALINAEFDWPCINTMRQNLAADSIAFLTDNLFSSPPPST